MRERAASGVLSREANVRARRDERTDGQSLPKGPIDFAGLQQGQTLSELPLQFGVNRESLGSTHRCASDRHQRLAIDTRFWGGEILRRAGDRNTAQLRYGNGAHLIEHALKTRVELIQCGLSLVEGDVAPAYKRLGVNLSHRTHLVDDLVHLGLGVARVVTLVVAKAAVTHNVENDVALERFAILKGQPG